MFWNIYQIFKGYFDSERPEFAHMNYRMFKLSEFADVSFNNLSSSTS